MEKFPARVGWHWVKQGLEVFRKQPGALMALFFSCMFVTLLGSLIPLLGAVLPALLAPIFSIALLQGCADIDHGKRALPNLLLSGFRKPARQPLLMLGLVYVGGMLVAMMVMRVLGADAMQQLVENQGKLDAQIFAGIRGAAIVAGLIYILGWMLTCLAAPLIYWQQMTLGKALFFSVVTVVRQIKAFATTAISLYVMCQVLSLLPLVLMAWPQLAFAAVFSVLLLMIVLMHCTLYAAYRQIFGTPPASPDLKPGQP